MKSLQREPAAAAGIVAALLSVALVYGIVTTEQATAWSGLAAVLVPLIPLAQARWTRRRVFSPDTIREAGYDPAAVQRRADDPRIPRCDR